MTTLRLTKRPTPILGLKAATYGPRCSSCQTALTAVLSPTLSLTVSLEVRKLDPLLLGPSNNAAMALHTLNRSGEALPLVEDVLRMEADMPPALWIKTMILTDLGRLDEATQLLTRLETLVAEKRLPEESYVLAQHAVAREPGDTTVADRALARIKSSISSPQSFFGYSAMDTIPYLVRHGKLEPALQLCTIGLKAGMVPLYYYDVLRLDSRLEPIRLDPRFQDVVSRARAQFEEEVTVLEEARTRGELPHYLEQPLTDLSVKLGMQRK
jgi:hypothetical protein